MNCFQKCRFSAFAVLIVGSLLALTWGAPPAFAQFNFPNFSSTANLTLNGSAARVGNVLRLTPNQQYKAGSAWFNTQQVVRNGFTATFQFRITNPSSTPADGIAFVIQNSPAGLTALGQNGGAIGYGSTITCSPSCVDGNDGISNSVAIEFDTFQNPWDPNANHLAVQSCGTSPNNSDHTGDCLVAETTTGLPTFTDGNVHTVVVNYDPCAGECVSLTVYVDGNTPVLTTFFNITSIGLAGELSNSAFVGFTGATGFFDENQDILNWSFTPHSGTTQNQILTFNPGTHVSQTATFNCTTNDTPCTAPEAHSLKLTVGQVTQSFSLIVSATEISPPGNGDCESGNPNDSSDFDCRFVNHFGTPGSGSSVIVPLCDPYDGGQCVYYRVENPPSRSKYFGPIDWYAAWNDDTFVSTGACAAVAIPTTYQCTNRQVAYDPSSPHPSNDPNQFTTYITTYFNDNPNQVGIDPGIGGKTPSFSDVAVVFPQTGSTLTFILMPPLRAGGPNVFESEEEIPVKFQLKKGNILINNAAVPPNVVGIAILDSNGVLQPIVPPGTPPPHFRFVGNHYELLLDLEDVSLPPGSYQLIINSNLFGQQTIPLTLTPED